MPPGIVALILIVAIVVAGRAVVIEVRRRKDVTAGARVVARILITVAIMIGLPAGFVSLFFASLMYEDPDCPPILGWQDSDPADFDPDLVARCEATSGGELAGLVTWTVVITVTAALLVAGYWLAGRSRIVGWVAVPLALAGCAVAYDLGNLAATVMR
ncbi:hypothetical protein [Flindersiella endophytica]